YPRRFNPDQPESAMLPATLSKELISDLLKGQMGFNGVVVTDASHMVAMTAAMKRRDMLPTSVAAGCDLFLFFNDPDEDFGYMMEGYKNGVITDERLHDALTRILGLKASLGLHKKPGKDLLLPKAEALAKIGLPENRAVFSQVADKAITLVKNKQDIFPLTPEKTRRILLVEVKGPESQFGKAIAGGGNPLADLKELLAAEGFDVSIYESPLDKIMKLPENEIAKGIMNVYAQKRPISELTDTFDLIISVANVVPGTVQRVLWPASKGTPDIPFYVFEVPSIFVSVLCPFHLADVPQMQTYINTYDAKKETLRLLVQKMVGRSEFAGTSPVDAFCGFVDTHY
ncbi:MAG: glycoside hydrolase family 3 protein, partial [Clostridia bacterium]|nr:glycoside hydrolase family 3 protein [Clostridia bacterium]